MTKIRKGVRVTTSGLGRTSSWGDPTGTVTHRRGTRVFVHWDNTTFEDEMTINEITTTETT